MPFQEALDVAEALVLLPEVDSVVPGRQLYTRAAAQDLQVALNRSFIHPFTHSLQASSFPKVRFCTGPSASLQGSLSWQQAGSQ